MRTKFELSSFGRCRDIEKISKFKSRSRDLDYVFFRPTFVLYIFYLQYFYVLNLNPIALVIRAIFTGVREFKV